MPTPLLLVVGFVFLVALLVAGVLLVRWTGHQQRRGHEALMTQLQEQLDARDRDTSAVLGQQHREDLSQAIDTLVSVAGERLDAQSRSGMAHLDGRKELIDAELARMGRTLSEVTATLQRVEADRSAQFGQMGEQLSGVARSHQALAQTTGALREALASSQARGQWGERMVDDVLRAAGFVEGLNYRTQVTTRSGTRPDVTFLLPGDQVVHLDVKFPLASYLAMVEADSDEQRAVQTRAFMKAVRERVKELAGRGYIDPEDGTLDCVLLFIPNEQVYGFIHESDAQLLDDALAQKVVLCSPSTLFAVLAVVRQAVDRVALERTSDEILQLLESFGAQWQRFTEAMDKVGRGLETTQKAYDALSSTRRNQMDRQLDRVAELRSRRDAADLSDSSLDEDSATLVAFERRSSGQ